MTWTPKDEVTSRFKNANNDDVEFILWECTAFPAASGEYICRQLDDLTTDVQGQEPGWRQRLAKHYTEQKRETAVREAANKLFDDDWFD